jgi:hypothetical protein
MGRTQEYYALLLAQAEFALSNSVLVTACGLRTGGNRQTMHVSMLGSRLTWGFSSSQASPQGLHRLEGVLVVTQRRTGEMTSERDPPGTRTMKKRGYIDVAGEAAFSDMSV